MKRALKNTATQLSKRNSSGRLRPSPSLNSRRKPHTRPINKSRENITSPNQNNTTNDKAEPITPSITTPHTLPANNLDLGDRSILILQPEDIILRNIQRRLFTGPVQPTHAEDDLRAEDVHAECVENVSVKEIDRVGDPAEILSEAGCEGTLEGGAKGDRRHC